MAENIGIMSGAFFVSKTELLKWLNETFHFGINKVEEVATGAHHCQILDAIFPGKVPLHKVNFNARYDYEYVNNYKVLQRVFADQNIAKHVDVEKLIKAKYQDNLEFLQWMKNLWDVRYGGQPYDAVGRREEAIRAFGKGGKGMSNPAPAAAPAAAPSLKKPAAKPAPSASVKKPAASTAAPARKPAATSSSSGADADNDGKYMEKVNDLNARIAKLKTTIEGLEKERNFYFGKLREIEIVCQTNEEEDAGTKSKVLEILYATDDNAEFEAPPEDETVENSVAAEYSEADPSEEIVEY